MSVMRNFAIPKSPARNPLVQNMAVGVNDIDTYHLLHITALGHGDSPSVFHYLQSRAELVSTADAVSSALARRQIVIRHQPHHASATNDDAAWAHSEPESRQNRQVPNPHP